MQIVKTGLYCVIGIVCAMLLLEFFVPSDPDKQTWPEQLLLQRQALEEQQEEDYWRNRLAQAGQDPVALERSVEEALTADNYLAAYKAARLFAPGEKREKAMGAIFASASQACNSLGWALAALQELNSPDRDRFTQPLLNKWEECQSRSQ